MKTFALLFAIFFAAGLNSCLAQGTWTQKADFGGTARWSTVGLSIGSKGYIGTGLSGSYPNYIRYKDFWEYDPTTDVWTQKADFGGTVRNGAVGFSIGSKGYIGTGDVNPSFYKDFWEYDASTNAWTQKADFGGTARSSAVGFSIGSKGYIGTGLNGTFPFTFYNDFWEYDPSTDTWTQKADFGGPTRAGAVGFSIGSEGYVGTGADCCSYYKDFWKYDPSTDIWTKKADFDGTARRNAVGFAIGSQGYIGTGTTDIIECKDFWEYNASKNTWSQKADFGGAARNGATGFVIGSKGYLGTGYYNFKDFWEYTSDASTCTVPTNLSSTNITSTTAKLKWNAINNAIFYKVSFKKTGTSEWKTIKTITNSKTLHELEANTEYTWKVKSLCSLQPTVASDWSEKFFFTTASLRAATESESLMVNIFPNPLSNFTTISFSLPKTTHTTIELYNLAGRKLQLLLDKNLAAGDHEVSFHRGNLIEGIYLLKVKTADVLEVRKLVIE